MNIIGVDLASGERQLNADLFMADEPSGAGVLLVHGYMSNNLGYAEYAEAITDKLGATCLALDLSGHGKSEGDRSEISINGHIPDVLAGFDFLAGTTGINKNRIGAVGASYGGYLATLLSVERPVAGLVLRAPAVYKDDELDIPREQMDEAANRAFRLTLDDELPAENRAFAAVRDFEGPALVVESENDESVPASVVRAYRRSAQNMGHLVILGAKHSLADEEREAFKQIVVDWAAEL